ncbi:MAG: creatininase family protein [Acidobacteriaceae bacterium]|nr:creatininase family protein [Acidobacteriaceae bacterium]
MHLRLIVTALALTRLSFAQIPQPNVDFALMTWPELKHAIHDEGRTTALIYNGGTEQRGPQGVTGAHTFVAHDIGVLIAQKLGNAILAPTIPFSPNRANPNLPGTIGISPALFAQLNEEVAEQLITNGFKSVVLMGDHGGGQKELAEVAKKLDTKYSGSGVRVVYCDDVYAKVGVDFDKWLEENHLPVGAHAAIKDTSELLYLGGDRNWVRKDQISIAVGRPLPKPGERHIFQEGGNGIVGDARPSTPEIGKRVVDLKVDYAVAQIRSLLAPQAIAKN